MTRRSREPDRSPPPDRLARALAVALVCSVAAASSARAQPAACTSGISPETAERVFAVLKRATASSSCKLEAVGTDRTTLEAHWSRDGIDLPALRVVARECAPATARPAGSFAVEMPRELAEGCPEVAARVNELCARVALERPAGETGSLRDPLFRAARAIFAGVLLLASALLFRGALRLRSLDARWVALGVAGFAGAFATRAALPFSLGNWYSEVLPASGPPPWMRFGPGPFAVQSLLRDAGVWSPRALLLSQLTAGAAALPLLLGVLRELRVGLAATAATLVLLLFAPLHARLSATASEHVLASTLCLALLLAWLRAARTGDRLWLGLALLLFPAVVATRVDMAISAALVLPWPFLRDRAERETTLPWRSLRGRSLALAVVAGVTLAGAYGFIAVPSHHPLPDPGSHVRAMQASVYQLWSWSTQDPAWISFPAALLAAVGVFAMAVHRPFLLARVAVTLLVTFAVLGRPLLADGLVGTRYFLFAIAVFLILPGHGFEALLLPVPNRARGAVASLGLVVLAAWTGLSSRSAYTARYAFEDEYAFLRRALTELPSDCTVYQVPIRSEAVPLDLDCCLDVERSPLVLDFPRLRFRDLPGRTLDVFEDGGCVAYYEGIVCQVADDPGDPSVHSRAEHAADYFRERCAEARALGRLEPLAETTTSPRATADFFRGKRPHAGLYRWTPDG